MLELPESPCSYTLAQKSNCFQRNNSMDFSNQGLNHMPLLVKPNSNDNYFILMPPTKI